MSDQFTIISYTSGILLTLYLSFIIYIINQNATIEDLKSLRIQSPLDIENHHIYDLAQVSETSNKKLFLRY